MLKVPIGLASLKHDVGMSNFPRSDRSMDPTDTYPTLLILDTVRHAFFH